MLSSKTVKYLGWNKGRCKTSKSFPQVAWMRGEANCHRGADVRSEQTL
jgi:hypothetical protein